MDFVKTVLDALRCVGYVAGEGLAAQVALLLASDSGSVRAMLLDGPPGAGKTFLAKSVARILGVDYVYVQAHPGSAPEDFLYDANIVQILRGAAGDRSAVQSAEDVVELGFLPTIFRRSQAGTVVAFVDELDKASPKVDSLFLSALQEGEVVVKGVGRIKADLRNLVIFFTKNNERPVSEPLMRRCRREYLGFPSAELELALLTGKVRSGRIDPLVVPNERVGALPEPLSKVLVTVANLLRANQEDLIKAPATQELQMAGEDVVRLARWGRIDLTGGVAFGWLAGFREDQEILEKLVSRQRLQEMISAAVKSSVAEIERRDLPDVNDEFAAFDGKLIVAPRIPVCVSL